MSFSQRFGTPLANVVLRFCRVEANAQLPNVHQVCAMNEKRSRDTANINICLCTQSLQTSYINMVDLPKVSPWMLDIFCQHNLVGNGMELGAGLNPFSVVCSGHHNTKDVLVLAKRQATVKAGATVSLSDTLEFKTKDAPFPQTYLQASDKLWAFCLLCRICFGGAHILYTALFESLQIVCPLIQNLECVFTSSKKEGLLIAIRAMLAYQSKVQAWLRTARATTTTTVVAAPNFSRILEAMESQTYDSLPRVPDQWMEIVKAQVAELWPVIEVPCIRGGRGGAGGGGMLPVLSKNKWKHPNPNHGLMTHWKAAFAHSYKNIGDLKTHWKGTGDYVVPKDPSGNELCLKCQYTRECKTRCGRSNCHLPYGEDIIAKLHQHLTDCGVLE